MCVCGSVSVQMSQIQCLLTTVYENSNGSALLSLLLNLSLESNAATLPLLPLKVCHRRPDLLLEGVVWVNESHPLSFVFCCDV